MLAVFTALTIALTIIVFLAMLLAGIAGIVWPRFTAWLGISTRKRAGGTIIASFVVLISALVVIGAAFPGSRDERAGREGDQHPTPTTAVPLAPKPIPVRQQVAKPAYCSGGATERLPECGWTEKKEQEQAGAGSREAKQADDRSLAILMQIKKPAPDGEPTVVAQQVILQNFDKADCPLVVTALRFGDGSISALCNNGETFRIFGGHFAMRCSALAANGISGC